MAWSPKTYSFLVCTECWNNGFDIMKPCCNSFVVEESRMKPLPEKILIQQFLDSLYYEGMRFRYLDEIKEYYIGKRST